MCNWITVTYENVNDHKGGYIYIYIKSFSRRFYTKRLTNEDNGSNQNQQKSNDTQVL